MWQKAKNLYAQLKSYKQNAYRERLYIVPSLSGFALSALLLITYLISYFDGNPWLSSLSFSGFAFFLISLFITQRNLMGLRILKDGQLKNASAEPKLGVRVDGWEVPEIPANGVMRIPLSVSQSRVRISTFSPTGLFYSWGFRKSSRSDNADLGERSRFFAGSPWARVDWKLWARRGRFESTLQYKNLMLRPVESLLPEYKLKKKIKTSLIDAPTSAFLWSLFVLFSFVILSFQYAPLLAFTGLFLWALFLIPSLFVERKKHFAGLCNFFFSWFFLVLIMIVAKSVITNMMSSLFTISLLLIPFSLNHGFSGKQNLIERLKNLALPVALTLAFLFTARSFLPKRGRVLGNYASSQNSSYNWSTSPLTPLSSLKYAGRFMSRGQGVFWVDFSKPLQLAYARLLPYWRVATYEKTLGGVDWFSPSMVSDLGQIMEVNRIQPGRMALILHREVPIAKDGLTYTANDLLQQKSLSFVATPKTLELIKTLNIDAKNPSLATQKILNWMKEQNFKYSLNPGNMSDLEEFLFRKKVGLCQHYAGALAYLLLTANFSARVVAGYQGGDLNVVNETLMLRDSDAHAWVEIWDPLKKAWFLVDPTFELFPNEYRNESSPLWVRFFSKTVVQIQSLWIKKRMQTIFYSMGLVLLSAIIFLGLFFKKKKLLSYSLSAPYSSNPLVKNWEEKMKKHFGTSRFLHESLSAYFERMIQQKSLDAHVLSELNKELVELNKRLYAPMLS